MGKEEDKIQKITNLLEKGGTMLASHHECGAPMFRYQGKTVCPVCDFQDEEVKAITETKPEQEPRKSVITQTGASDYQIVSRVIMSKIKEIATGLEAETDLQRVKNKMECIEQGIKILKLLQE